MYIYFWDNGCFFTGNMTGLASYESFLAKVSQYRLKEGTVHTSTHGTGTFQPVLLPGGKTKMLGFPCINSNFMLRDKNDTVRYLDSYNLNYSESKFN